MSPDRRPALWRRRACTGAVDIALALALAGAAALALAAPAPAGPASAATLPAHPLTASPKPNPPPAPVKLVDINSAGKAELKTLPGIGDAEAEKIIANRPYLSKAELVTKKVMPTGPYLQLRHRVVAMQKARPKAKPH